MSPKLSVSRNSHAADSEYMSLALEKAWAVKGKTFPNPAVGAVVVSGGKVVGSGATSVCGGPHAEIVALGQAGKKARGATLYVTLEPCSHYGRTPPCAGAVIDAGIRRVVAAAVDPNPLVNGKGIARLREAGVSVELDVLGEEAAGVNEDYFWYIRKRRAWITLKLACTLDGRIADERGDSKWITCEAGRTFAHELRRRHAAVAVGRATLDRDDPRLTVRHLKGFAPARCVFTSGTMLPPGAFFSRNAKRARSIVVVAGGSERTTRRDEASGIEYWFTGETDPVSSLFTFSEMAFENGLSSVLVEGGRKLASGFLESGLVNRLYLFYGNKLFGRGLEGFLFGKGLPVKKPIRLRQMRSFLVGETLVVTGIPSKGASG